MTAASRSAMLEESVGSGCVDDLVKSGRRAAGFEWA